nr:hypothetical protein [uncultured Kingella sp.]
MIRRWLALTYYLYALRLAALSHFYFNRLYACTLFQGSLKTCGQRVPALRGRRYSRIACAA